jgi:2'-5' RNA ligase
MRVGRRFYTVYVTLEGQDDLHRLVDDYQKSLAEIPHLDTIPRPWRHMTVQGIGFSDEVSAADIARIADASQRHLATLSPVALTFRRPAVSHTTEAVTLGPDDGQGMHAIRQAIRAGIADVWGAGAVLESDAVFRPHTSLGYINADGPAQPIRDAIDTVHAAPAHATIDSVALIEMHRDQQMYQWREYARLRLGGV